MLFEILSTVAVTVSAALVVATLSFALATTATRRIWLAALLTAWFVLVVLLGATWRSIIELASGRRVSARRQPYLSR